MAGAESIMTDRKTAMAVVPPTDNRAVKVDRTVNGDLANVTDVVAACTLTVPPLNSERTGAPTGGIRMHLDRSAKIAIVALRARLCAEQRVELERFRAEFKAIRAETLEARAELAAVKRLLGIETITADDDHAVLH
jgi:hypothetical protein